MTAKRDCMRAFTSVHLISVQKFRSRPILVSRLLQHRFEFVSELFSGTVGSRLHNLEANRLPSSLPLPYLPLTAVYAFYYCFLCCCVFVVKQLLNNWIGPWLDWGGMAGLPPPLDPPLFSGQWMVPNADCWSSCVEAAWTISHCCAWLNVNVQRRWQNVDGGVQDLFTELNKVVASRLMQAFSGVDRAGLSLRGALGPNILRGPI